MPKLGNTLRKKKKGMALNVKIEGLLLTNLKDLGKTFQNSYP